MFFSRVKAYRPWLCIGVLMSIWSCYSSRQPESNPYTSAQTTPTRGDWVILHNLSDPDQLNPTNYQGADAGYIISNLYMSLLTVDPRDTSFPYVPALAKGLPEISKDGLSYTFEIHPAAAWDNGSPVTAEDIAFSIKVIKNPLVDCAQLRPYYEFIEDVIIDPKNNRLFTVVTNRKYMLALSSIGTLSILPRYVYDPQNYMGRYSIRQLNREAEKLRNDPNLQAFARRYNAMQREPQDIIGCGPYLLESWETGQQVVLRRKPRWWGDTIQGLVSEAYPEKLVYRVVNDPNVAITNLKAQKLDVMHSIPAKDFIQLKSNTGFLTHYVLHTPPMFAYSYIGLNMRPQGRSPIFTDKRVRRALAHLVDVEMFIKKFSYGMAQRITGPLYPMCRGAYNDTLRPIPYDPIKAAQLLDEAGWVDQDGDGIREKVINSRPVKLEFEILVNAGNEVRFQIAQIIQQEAYKVGMKANIVSVDWSIFVDRTKKHAFDAYIGGWVGSHNPQDLKQIWHTKSWAEGGSNYVGFGTELTDSLIMAIREEVDESRRNALYRAFHQIAYEEQPYVFLTAPYERIAIHKRFRNAYTSPIRPGYNPTGFWTPREHVRYDKVKSEP